MHQGIDRGVRNRQERHFHHALRRAGLAAAALWGLVAVEPATAKSQSLLPASLPAVRDSLPPSGPAEPTPAWLTFCEQLAQECAVDASEPAVVSLSEDLWSRLKEVNERVNRMILPVTDQDHWGVVDRWDYPDDGLGDCEDIQLLKRKLLIEAGVPRRALRMTVAIDEHGEGHAVLMVRTDLGDFILDNKSSAVLAWHRTGYRYVKREGTDGMAWVWLGNQMAPIVTATK